MTTAACQCTSPHLHSQSYEYSIAIFLCENDCDSTQVITSVSSAKMAQYRVGCVCPHHQEVYERLVVPLLTNRALCYIKLKRCGRIYHP